MSPQGENSASQFELLPSFYPFNLVLAESLLHPLREFSFNYRFEAFMLKEKRRFRLAKKLCGEDAHMYMNELFGAWQVDANDHQGAAEFKLFFPDRARDSFNKLMRS